MSQLFTNAVKIIKNINRSNDSMAIYNSRYEFRIILTKLYSNFANCYIISRMCITRNNSLKSRKSLTRAIKSIVLKF